MGSPEGMHILGQRVVWEWEEKDPDPKKVQVETLTYIEGTHPELGFPVRGLTGEETVIKEKYEPIVPFRISTDANGQIITTQTGKVLIQTCPWCDWSDSNRHPPTPDGAAFTTKICPETKEELLHLSSQKTT